MREGGLLAGIFQADKLIVSKVHNFIVI
jgi:hypothetical protein